MTFNPFIKKDEEEKPELDLMAALAKADEPEDLSDIPEELIEKFKLNKISPYSEELLEIVTKRGGVASFANVKADMIRKYGDDCPKEGTLAGRINKAISEGHLFSVDGRRGMYSIAPLSVRENKGDSDSDDTTE